MRLYHLTVTSHGHRPIPNTPKECNSPTAKVGTVALVIFRRIFGHNPNREFWQKKGFMAEASDQRGNRVLVEQINFDHYPGFDRKTGTFPIIRHPDFAS